VVDQSITRDGILPQIIYPFIQASGTQYISWGIHLKILIKSLELIVHVQSDSLVVSTTRLRKRSYVEQPSNLDDVGDTACCPH
jgi:hypothetical protein